MRYFLLKKAAVISALVVVLTLAINMTSGIIQERNYYQNTAKNDIARAWTGKQQLVGPILVLPYRQQVLTEVWDEQQKQKRSKLEYRHCALFAIPEDLHISGQIDTELRYRGLYGVPVYTSRLKIHGKFDAQTLLEIKGQARHVANWENAYIAVIVQDIRGIPAAPELSWAGQAVDFKPGSAIGGAPQGMHAIIPYAGSNPDDLSFSFELSLRGMETLNFAPVGVNTRVELTSPWQHPSFNGDYLPERHAIDEQGFSANWRVSSFSSNIELAMDKCQNGNCQALLANQFGVSLIQPIDIYHLSERSTKYGILFISLTFIAFFVFEVIKRHPIHPIQYLLVGFALALFYLLLISLSEHIAFAWAYPLAACACTALLGYYLSAVLRGLKAGLLFSAALAILYAVLYVIIGSEDSALLMGSVLLFLMLALLMTVTRRIDWYKLSHERDAGSHPI